MTRRSPVLALVAWVLLAWCVSALVRALAVALGPVALVPQPAYAFLSLSALRAPLPLTLGLAFVLGSEVAHAAAAPAGVVEASFVWAAALVAWGRARWLRRGARDVALSAAAMSLGVQMSIGLWSLFADHAIGLTSRAALLCVPGALIDGLVALVAFSPLDGMWRRLTVATSARAIAMPKG